jgi:hypothetical protein
MAILHARNADIACRYSGKRCQLPGNPVGIRMFFLKPQKIVFALAVGHKPQHFGDRKIFG